MTRLAKAMSAFTNGRSASAAGRNDGRSLATRGASRDFAGSGAPSGRGRSGLLVLALATVALVAFAPQAQAGKVVDRVLAGSTAAGATQGLFDDPRGIAVNFANVADATTDPLGNSTDGYVYVVDEDRMRVQVFSPDGTFRFMWGRSVVNGGDGAQICDSSEVPCTSVTTADDEEGEFDDPQGIAINQATGDVYVRDRDNRRVQQFKADGTFVRAWGHDVATAASPDNTGTGFEICTSLCKVGTTGVAGGQLATSSTSSTGIAVVPAGAPNAGNVIVADPGNRRIQEFGPTGTWVRAWGWDVIVPGGTGEATKPINEHQLVKVGNAGGILPSGGPYTLTFAGQTTAPIPVDAPAAQVDAALEALSTIGPGNVNVTGNDVDIKVNAYLSIDRTVEFTGALGGSDQPLLTGDASGVGVSIGAATVLVSTTTPGGSGPSFEVCTVAAECKAAANSAPADLAGAFATNNPVHLAVDSGGTVYASDSAGSNRVQRFDSTEALAGDLLKSSIDVAALTSTATDQATGGLAVDPSNGNLFVARVDGIGTLEFSDPDGAPAEVDRHYQGAGLSGSSAANGIALDGSGDDLYLASSSNGHRVFAADDDGAPAAIVTIEPPTNLEAHAATFTGTVNPNSALPTSYRFQYSRNGVTWTDVAPAFGLGGGASPIAVDDEVTGLEANAFYRVRIVTQKPFGNAEESSPELTFLTDAVGPELSTLYPQKRTATTARLAGMINPNNLPTAYRFEYGTTTAYGSVAPVPDGNVSGGADQLLFAEIAGLKPDTTYHVRLVATNAEGTTKGQDVSFDTRSVLLANERAYEMVTPPFKATRANVVVAKVEFNANLGLPSLSGDTLLWATQYFPLTEEVGAPQHFDFRRIQRTAGGWVNHTLNTLKLIGPYGAGSTHEGVAGSGDLNTFAWHSRDSFLPHNGSASLSAYTYREGTGTEGYTPWFDDTEANVTKFGLRVGEPSGAPALLNDAGTAMARSGEFRDLLDDPGAPGDEDPSGEQQLYGSAGGRTIYHVRSANPNDLPAAEKDLVNECTGALAEATELPARIGTGTPTDTIGTFACAESDGAPEATGTGTLANNSPTVTGLSTESGTFSPGQVISGGPLSGFKITAVGAGTLTLSAPVVAGGIIRADLTSGSPQITVTLTQSGFYNVGQSISGPGIPAGTTIEAINGSVLTLSQAASATSTFTQLLVNFPGPTVALSADDQHLTSVRGAGLGGGGGGLTATALSDDGRRAFFTSPESNVPSCATTTGASTSCPPQLFVRQYDENGENPQVRWISHSRSNPVGEGGYGGAMIAGQQIAEMGKGAIFQGASRDGGVVYFTSNSPLTPDDPNAGQSITSGSAQDNSWDLFRYELPEDLSDDPGEGVLTRITGGPTGNADPNVSSSTPGASLRFLSDDGDRAYFVTRAPIAGADEAAPKGGSTVPGGAVGSNSVRNLYLFDANESGAVRYRFVAQLPATGDWNSCATTTTGVGRQVGTHSSSGFAVEHGVNCFRGTPDGSHVLFSTRGQLTPDDDDDAGDLYLYDADVDELIRVTAPPAGAVPYVCKDKGSFADSVSIPVNDCNGQLSFGGIAANNSGGEAARGWGGLRYENIAKDAKGVVSVFFESRSQLVPEDVNGNRFDVYEWREGELSLISTGDSPDNSWFSGNSVDGRDVFFFTSKAIDPREIDFQDYDIYDARIGGGFPYTPPPTPCDVLAFECETEAIPAAAPRSATSASLSGEGNHKAKATPKPRKCAKGKVLRKGKCVTRKAKRSHGRAAKTTGRADR